MADAPAFDWVCSSLEESTSFDRLEARGTVRLALKSAGLDAGSVTSDQMRVVVDKVLPGELASRGVDDAPAVCSRLTAGLASAGLDVGAPRVETPDAVFSRLGGGS